MPKRLSRKLKERVAKANAGDFHLKGLPTPGMIGTFEKMEKNICGGCWFRGKEPLVAIYPEEDGFHPFREAEEISWTDISDGFVDYLSITLNDFNTREAAEDALFQMIAQIQGYLDDQKGKTTAEKMQAYQDDKLGKIFSKMKPEEYKARYDEWIERFVDVGTAQPIVGIDAVVEFSATKQAYLDTVKKLNGELSKKTSDYNIMSKAMDEIVSKYNSLKEKQEKEKERYELQVKALTKEIKGLEADMRRMEKQNGGTDEAIQSKSKR